MSTSKSSYTRRSNRNSSNNPREHFQSRQTNFDEFKMTQENELQDTFRAVVLSSPIDENNVGTSKVGPNARITEAGFIEISVKPISDQEFERISEDGTVFYGMSPVNNPVPGDSMPSFYDLKKDDTDRFLDLVKRYHSTDDLKATSVEPVGGLVSLKFGQIVNCYYRTGNANNPFTIRGDLVFETPDNEVIHPFYTSFMQQSEVNSAKEPFANNSSRAVSVFGSISSSETEYSPSDENSGRSERPPSSPNITSEDNELLNLIASKESQGNYNAANVLWYPSELRNTRKNFKAAGGTTDQTYKGKKLENLTFAEVYQAQKSYYTTRYPKTKPANTWFAMGKFQIIPDTMKAVKSALGFKDTDLFSKENQDKAGMWLIYGGQKRRVLSDYLLGGTATLDAAQNDLAREFSSIPKSNGEGHYPNESDHLHDGKKVRDALKKCRDANIASGRSGI